MRSYSLFRYQGQYEDSETGLYYNRFRYYSPEMGGYISQDPIGLLGGNHLYGYVNNVNYLIDPIGLSGMPRGGWNYGNMPKIDDYQWHHVIPKSKIDHPAIKAAGYEVNKPNNLIYLPKEAGTHPTRSVHSGWNKEHAAYNDMMGDKLDKLYEKGMKKGWNQQKFHDEVSKLSGDTRRDLRKGKIKCH